MRYACLRPRSSWTVGAAPVTLPEPFYAWDQHVAIDLGGARALFTTRRGGFSSGP